MDEEQAKPKAPLSMKSLQERIASLEVEHAQLELKHDLLYEAHQKLQQDFEAYKNMHLLKKLLGKRPEG